MTSIKFQINYNVQKFNDQNSFAHPYRQVLIIDIWNLSIRTSFVICFLLFGALIQNGFTLWTNTK